MSNGVGPAWFPAWVRDWLTKSSERFFNEAAWEKHDEGYGRGSPGRAICDLKFWQAMLRDASQAPTVWKVIGCLWLSTFFYIMVRLFGMFAYKEGSKK